MVSLRSGSLAIALSLVLGSWETQASCRLWKVEGFDLGMSIHEVREIAKVGGPWSTQQSSNSLWSRDGTPKTKLSTSVRARDKRFKGKVKFTNDQLTFLRIRYRDADWSSLANRLADELGQSFSVSDESIVFESRECNARIHLLRDDKGILVELEPLR